MGRSKARRKYRTLGYRYVAKECMCWSEEVEVVKVREGEISLSLSQGGGEEERGRDEEGDEEGKRVFRTFFPATSSLVPLLSSARRGEESEICHGKAGFMRGTFSKSLPSSCIFIAGSYLA